tara:strand:+ start:849 stop:1553 length:705 start_codon:yes stop_codon:yes gene_type:complete
MNLYEKYDKFYKNQLNEAGPPKGFWDELSQVFGRKPIRGTSDIGYSRKPGAGTPVNGVHGVADNIVWGVNDFVGNPINWRPMFSQGIAPEWWTGSFDEFLELFLGLESAVLRRNSVDAMNGLEPLFGDFMEDLLNLLYNPNNMGVPGMPGIFNDLLNDPIFIQLFDQGWEFGLVDGTLQFFWGNTQHSSRDVRNLLGTPIIGDMRPALPPIPEGPLGQLGQILSDFFANNPFGL